MRFDEVRHLLSALVEALPKTCPRPRLILHESPEAMVEYLGDTRESFTTSNGYHPTLVQAMAEDAKNIVHISLPFCCEPIEVVVHVLLHELGHLYYAKLDGGNSERAMSEQCAEAFARRWGRYIRKDPKWRKVLEA